MLGLLDYEHIIHNQVVAARAKQLGFFYRVIAEPHLIRHSSTDNIYPDLIVLDADNNVLFIEEVATENSITERERDKHWLVYSKLGYPFNLIVPQAKIATAEKLIKSLSINKVYYFKLSNIDIKFRQTTI